MSRRERRRRKLRRVIRNWAILMMVIAAIVVLICAVIVPAISNTSSASTEAASAQGEEDEERGGEKKSDSASESASESAKKDDSEETPVAETTTLSEEALSDTTPPVIEGQDVIFVAKGAKVMYKSYVYVEDDRDPDPSLSVDNSDVDLSKEGTYTVIYTATDWAGNTSVKEVTLKVGAEEEPDVSEDVIYAKADEVLASIIDDGMSDLEKVFAVFFYVRDTFTYVKDDNYWEYKQEAYHMMTTLADNCYANVCVSKLLLERLGFESFMVTGDLGYVDEHHYWNMVSIDGGQTWYQYDSAWWTWMNDEYPLCMMTDEFADIISRAHGGIFNPSSDDYPKTPTEPLWTPEQLGYTSKYIDENGNIIENPDVETYEDAYDETYDNVYVDAYEDTYEEEYYEDTYEDSYEDTYEDTYEDEYYEDMYEDE